MCDIPNVLYICTSLLRTPIMYVCHSYILPSCAAADIKCSLITEGKSVSTLSATAHLAGYNLYPGSAKDQREKCALYYIILVYIAV